MRFFNPGHPAGRLEYLLVQIGLYAIAYFATVMMIAFDVNLSSREFSYNASGITAWAFIIVGVLGVSFITVLRRMHDLHLGSGWVFLHFLPLISIFFHLYLLLSSGISRQTYAPYGDNPLDPNSWVPSVEPGQGGGTAVSFQGKPLLLPGEENWSEQDAA
ncbi:MAG: DUF805 domain-containing protein [Acidimicrobiales bacterium]